MFRSPYLPQHNPNQNTPNNAHRGMDALRDPMYLPPTCGTERPSQRMYLFASDLGTITETQEEHEVQTEHAAQSRSSTNP